MLSPTQSTQIVDATPVDDEPLEGKDLGLEIASIAGGRDITRPYIDPLGNLILPQDEVLLLKGQLGWRRLELYEKVRQDDQVFSCMQQRISAVKQAEWEVLPGERPGRSPTKADQKAADFVRDQLTNGFGARSSWDSCMEKMHWGLLYGYSVAECLYGQDGRYVSLDANRGGIRVRNRKRFQFDVQGNPRLITPTGPYGEVLPPQKFWHFCTGADHDDEPYGLGLGHWLYWPTWFKRNDLKFWLFFLEKFGQPTAVGTYQAGVHGKTEQDKLMASLYAILTDGGIIKPEGMTIDLLEATRSGTADYESVYDHMNAAISKIILSQTMTTDDGSSLSQATVHERVGDAVKKGDADLLNGSFNGGPVRWLVDYNRAALGDCEYPTVWRRIEPEEDVNARADREPKLFQVGYQLTPEKFEEIYGDGYEPIAGAAVGYMGAQAGTPAEPEEAIAAPEQSPEIPAENVQSTALNGAQITSLVQIVQAVTAQELPMAAAIELIQISFPMVDAERAQRLLESTEGFEPASQPLSPSVGEASPEGLGEGAEPPREEAEEDEPDPAATDAQFAAATPTADLYAQRLQQQNLFAPLIAQIRAEFERQLRDGGSLEDFQAWLNTAYPDLEGEQIEQSLAQAMTATRLAGLYEAQEGE